MAGQSIDNDDDCDPLPLHSLWNWMRNVSMKTWRSSAIRFPASVFIRLRSLSSFCVENPINNRYHHHYALPLDQPVRPSVCLSVCLPYLVEMVDRGVRAGRVHVLLLRHARHGKDIRIVERSSFVSPVRETARDSNSSDRILHTT